MTEDVLTLVPGNIWKVLVSAGDQVTAGQTLFIMEVMKTEVAHQASIDGVVTGVFVTEGQEGVDADFVALTIAS